jgi:L-rhamnose isomerase/sugar isomerase
MQKGKGFMNERAGKQNIDNGELVEKIQHFTVETPSWGYGDSGTRFKVFHWPGAARTLREKLEDAAQVNAVTGVCPSVAIHIPWDLEDDWQEVKAYAERLGLRIGAVNPNLFQEDAYRLGSLSHIDKQVRKLGIAHVRECIQIAQAVDSDIISLWLADGTKVGSTGRGVSRHRPSSAGDQHPADCGPVA